MTFSKIFEGLVRRSWGWPWWTACVTTRRLCTLLGGIFESLASTVFCSTDSTQHFNGHFPRQTKLMFFPFLCSVLSLRCSSARRRWEFSWSGLMPLVKQPSFTNWSLVKVSVKFRRLSPTSRPFGMTKENKEFESLLTLVSYFPYVLLQTTVVTTIPTIGE